MILGCKFSQNSSALSHVEDRINSCRRTFHSLADKGLCFPHGLSTKCKQLLLTSVCQPVLMYGIACLNVTPAQLDMLDKYQGSLVKKCLGLPVRCHHSLVVEALGLKKCSAVAISNMLSLMHRAMSCMSPTRDILLYTLNDVKVFRDTLPHRISANGFSPFAAACGVIRWQSSITPVGQNGLLDSIRTLLQGGRYSFAERDLLFNLVKCF